MTAEPVTGTDFDSAPDALTLGDLDASGSSRPEES